VKFLTKRFRERLLKHAAKKKDVDLLYQKVFSLIQVDRAMRGHPVIRPDNGWSIGLDALNWILSELQNIKNPRMLEFGCGRSTVILASVLAHHGGSLDSIEQDQGYLLQAKSELENAGLDEFVTMTHAPLGECGGEGDETSYDINCLPEGRFDVILVDGPPTATHPFGRHAPLSWALSRVTEDGVVFLDDADRANERNCLARLQDEFPECVITLHRTEKGLAQITLKKNL
jgi:hypothetical protein